MKCPKCNAELKYVQTSYRDGTEEYDEWCTKCIYSMRETSTISKVDGDFNWLVDELNKGE